MQCSKKSRAELILLLSLFCENVYSSTAGLSEKFHFYQPLYGVTSAVEDITDYRLMIAMNSMKKHF